MSHEETISTPAKPREPRTWGLMAEYDDVGSLIAAAEQVRDAGYTHWDCHTPFPVHGLDRAMGMKKTILPWIVLGAALTGIATAILLQFYVNSPITATAWTGILGSYPMVFSGKPYWSLPANVPIIFELTVLFSALTTFSCVWLLNGLPMFYHPTSNNARFRKVTDDKFFIVIEAKDSKFHLKNTAELLLTTHSAAVEEIKD